jgi:hypothetical protein
MPLPPLAGDQPFGVSLETFFNAPTDGEYTLTIGSDGGTMLFLHDLLLLISEAKVPTPGRISGSAPLHAGWHPLRLLYRWISTTPKLSLTGTLGGGAPLTPDESNLRQRLE